MRPLLTVLFSAALVVALPAPAYAHPDVPIANGTIQVEAGGFAAFPLRVHFHRLVGGFDVVAPAGAGVAALLMDDEAFGAYAAGKPAPYLYSSGSSAGAKVNVLIACCHRFDVVFSQQYDRELRRELTYTPYHLVIDNRDSASPATVRLRATLVHDFIAVIVYGGEPFALGPVGAPLALIGALLSRSVLRALRGGRHPAGGAGASRRNLLLAGLASLALYVAAAAAMLGAALAGSAAYGGGLAEGLIARQAENPNTTEIWYERLSAGDALALAVPLAWVLSIVLWAWAFAPALRARLRLVGAIGVLEGAGPLLLAGLVVLSYGAPIVPILGGAIVGLPQVLGGLALIRSSPRRGDDEAVARDSARVMKRGTDR